MSHPVAPDAHDPVGALRAAAEALADANDEVERVRLERRRLEVVVEAVLERVDDAVVVVDPELRVLACSNAARHDGHRPGAPLRGVLRELAGLALAAPDRTVGDVVADGWHLAPLDPRGSVAGLLAWRGRERPAT